MVHRRIGGIAAVLFLLLGSCGESTPPQASPETPSTAAAFPVTITAANGDVTLEERPERIVSLSPTATEMLFAIGAGDQVEAVDDQSNYPPEAPVTDLSGFEPNVEAIASFEPDLVVYATEPGDLGASLEGLGIPALQQDAAASLDDVYAQIDQLGMATGHASEATELVEGMRGDIDTIVDSIDPTEPSLTLLPRARRHLLLGHLVDVHRSAVRAHGIGEHRGRGEGRGGWLSATLRRIHHPGEP